MLTHFGAIVLTAIATVALLVPCTLAAIAAYHFDTRGNAHADSEKESW